MSDAGSDSNVLLTLLREIHTAQKEQGHQLQEVRERLLRIEAQGHSDKIEDLDSKLEKMMARLTDNSDRLLVIETKGKTATTVIAMFVSALMSLLVGIGLWLVKGT